ncbi:helix-turn-helix transcriptional regulator [Heyndrickxia faecalis]|uniref:helix-turn-helix domain-containing protein n=1 Tax=Heyndrickxia TaxID=2837504 RepID=UPI0031013FC0
MDQTIGQKIKQLRKEHKDTLKSLAAKIDYDWSNLSKVERGVYSASMDLLNKIIKVYDVNPNYFFEGLTDQEGKLLREEELNPADLKKKYVFKVDGVEATEEEIEEAIRLIRLLRDRK